MKSFNIIQVMAMLVILFPMATIISGCPAGTYGSVISPEQRAAIVRGKTTKEEVLRQLGYPDQTIDIGGGKKELSYIQETVASRANYGGWGNSTKSQFWIILNNNVVEAFGERSTSKSPSYIKWPFSGS